MTMPTLGLPDADIQSVIGYLMNPLAFGPAPAPPAVALPAGNALVGREIFTGARPLQNGGVNCIACHTISGVAALGGGSLGPDLTHVVTRLGGPGLTAAISNIVFPTMAGPFTGHPLTPQEIADLAAFFTSADQQTAPLQIVPPTLFWSIGAACALLLFAGLAFFWPRQRRSLSDQLRAGLDKGRLV
jgi:hypothetical protein